MAKPTKKSMSFNNILIAVLLVVLVSMQSIVYVYEGSNALVERFGKLNTDSEGNAVLYMPGLHFVVPFIDKVKYIDIRIQTFDVPSDRIYTKEQKTVKLDYFVKWRVEDIYKFYLTTNADYRKSNSSLRGKINDGLRSEVGMRELKDVITGERGNIIAMLKTKAKEGARNFGIEIIDVRIVKLDYPPEVTQSVYERMRASRDRMATMYRAEGDAESEVIRARGDAEVVSIKAEANEEAARIIAKGHAEAALTYREAYSQNKDFFNFTRKLQLYESAAKNGEKIILDANSVDLFDAFLPKNQPVAKAAQ